jgi:putative hydrolase of the HAD superfamily
MSSSGTRSAISLGTTIRAVFLDVDDTLVDYDNAARRAFAAVLGADADYERFCALDHYARFLSGEFGFEEMRERRMAEFLTLVGRTTDAVEAAEIERRRFEGLAEYYTLFDDVLPCLAALRARGLRLGLITNNESVHQRAKIRAVGLDELVDVIVISGELGIAKPAAAIFAHACALLGVASDEALHVGDNLDADAYGAHGAGVRAVWLDRRRSHDGSALEFAVIAGLDELPALIACASADGTAPRPRGVERCHSVR